LTFVGAGGAPGATFGWNFGDGSTASGQTATHVYGTEGTFSVVLTVSSGGQAATATGTATAKSITGRWSEDTGATIALTQKGSVFDGYHSSPLSGMVFDPRHVVWTRQDRCAEHFDLTADSTITTMTGTKNNLNCSPGNVRPVTVTRQ
jgi:PKD repeat protein